MHENCDCLKIHDVTLTLILDAVCTLSEIYCQTALFSIHRGHFSPKKSMIFGKSASITTFSVKFHAGTEKSLWDFRPPLLEQPINRQLC